MIGILAAADPILSFGGIEGSGGVLNDVLATFTRLLNNGGDKIIKAEAELCGVLLMLQLLRFIVLFGVTPRSAGQGMFRLIASAGWFTMATNAVAITSALASWMGSMGAFLSDGAERGTDIMTNPSGFVGFGVTAFKNLYEQTNKFSIWDGLSFSVFFIVMGFMVLICYSLLGFLVMWVTCKAKLDMLLGLSLIPFVIEDSFKPLAGIGVGLIVAAAIRLGATSLAVGASYSFISQITLPPEPTTGQAIRLLLAVAGCLSISGGVAMVSKVVGATVGAKRLFG